MAKIRSVTYFADMNLTHADEIITRAGDFEKRAGQAFLGVGFEVQTRRLATQPFPRWLKLGATEDMVGTVKQVYDRCKAHGIDYISIGPVEAQDDVAYIKAIEDICRALPGVFATAVIADPENGIDLQRLLDVACLTQELSRVTSDGMTNLYFAALANCQAGAPFFPVAYHGGGEPTFALAIQAADIAWEAFHLAPDPITARDLLTAKIQETADRIVPQAELLARDTGVVFAGLDFSLAPYPTHTESLGGTLEELGVQFGGQGLIASASMVMNAIEAADFPRAGFCGLMLPILEDIILAERTIEGRLRMNDLLLLSAVCGTGLDCIPLPGDISDTSLRDILLDVAALALRLDKPLTARLMPFPGKSAGDALSFDFEFFADSAVMPAPLTSKTNLGFDTATNTHFNVTPRKNRHEQP